MEFRSVEARVVPCGRTETWGKAGQSGHLNLSIINLTKKQICTNVFIGYITVIRCRLSEQATQSYLHNEANDHFSQLFERG